MRNTSERRDAGRLRAAALGVVFSCLVLPSAAADQAQRQQQIDQAAKHFEQSFRPVLEGELELARKTCGSLSPAARRQILAAGKEAVPTAARQFAARQFGGRREKPSDPRQPLLEAIRAAIKPHATPEEFAAYERELAARSARRDRATRTLIVAKLDQELHLSISQRAAIEADLEKNWQEAWLVELGDRGMNINGRRPAPDFADRFIAPHLDERQKAAWKAWCDQAGWKRFGQGAFSNWQHDGRTLEPDPWWTP